MNVDIPYYDPFGALPEACPRCRSVVLDGHGDVCTALLTARRAKEHQCSQCAACGHMEREHRQSGSDRLSLQIRGLDPDDAPVLCMACMWDAREAYGHEFFQRI